MAALKFLMPNKGSYTESLIFMTKMFTSSNNIITSEALMEEVKHSCSFEVTITNQVNYQFFINRFTISAEGPSRFPLLAQAVVGSTSTNLNKVDCDTTLLNLTVGDHLFIFFDIDYYYEVIVDSFTTTDITFSETITNEGEVFVSPTMLALVTGEIGTNYSGQTSITGSVKAVEYKEA